MRKSLKFGINAVVAITCMVFFIYWVNAHDDDRWQERGVVIETGNTHGGEGFFSGNVETGSRIRWDDGTVSTMTVYGNIMKGQVVYKTCFYDDGVEFYLTSADISNHKFKYKRGNRYYKSKELADEVENER